MSTAPSPRVALVHDWLTGMRGGEAVLEAIAELFPDAPIYTLLAYPEKLSPALRGRDLRSSWMQRLPGVEKKYRHYLPLMPAAIESLDLRGYDLIISSSHCVAKGIRKKSGAFHLSYVHAPMRYMWDRFEDYFGPGRAGWITRSAALSLRPVLQSWDRRSSLGVDAFISNSAFIGSQVERIYGRTSAVVHPFADLSRFAKRERRPEGFYLMVGAFAPYKRVDLAIEACQRLGLPLKIVGSGQDEKRLRSLAGPAVEFLGSCSDDEVAQLYSRAKAFLFPGIEDFGITPVEAMSSGVPVIAFGQGGALETVTPETGRFFFEPTVDALVQCLEQFEAEERTRGSSGHEALWRACRERAGHFTRRRFQEEFVSVLRNQVRDKSVLASLKSGW